MAKSSLEYWRDREETQRQKNIKQEAAYDREIEKIHNRMIKDIQDKINAFYGRFATSEGLTLAEAKKKVSAFDVEAVRDKMAKYVKDKDFSKKANAELKLYNATMKINRLEMLKSEIGLDLVDNYDELEKLFGEELTERTMEEFKRQAGILGESVIRPEKLAHSIVNASFHNAEFSDRIWSYHDVLKSDLDKILSEALIQGLHPRDFRSRVMPNIRDNVKNKNYAAMRLLATELCRVQIDAQAKSYERNGYESYKYLAEPTACPHCKALDNKVFRVEKMVIGENAPPMHPNCRCSTTAYFDDTRAELSGVEQAEKPNADRQVDDLYFDSEYAEPQSNWANRFFTGANFKTGDKDLKGYIESKREIALRTKEEITDKWIKQHRHIRGSVIKADNIIVDGVRYHVDGNNVEMNPSHREIEVANILKNLYGINVIIRPRVNKPEGIKTADYCIDNDLYDLKSLKGSGKNTLYNIVYKNIKQADNFILDLDKSPLRGESVDRQIDKIFSSDHTLSVNKIIILYDNEIKKVYGRRK